MKYLLAIDPGAKTGIAWFTHTEKYGWKLAMATTLRPDDKTVFVTPDIVVIEMPRINAHGKARPDDILKLATIVGRYQERFRDAPMQRLVRPHEWKGSVDGDIFTDRIRAALTSEEAPLCKNADHNALDAVGLGKWALRQPWMRAR